MKINAKLFWEQVEAILNEDGISLNELAIRSGLQYHGLSKIRDGITTSIQHATMRKIAEATGRKFIITGDSVTFVKAAQSKNDDLSEDEREMLDLLRGLDDEQRSAAMELLRATWKLGRGRRKPSNSGEN